MIASLCITLMQPSTVFATPCWHSVSVLESDIQKACLDYLAMRGIFAWRQNQGAIPLADGGFRRFNGMKGQSDIIGICPDGRFLAIEVKRPGNKPTEDQWQFIENIQKHGGVAMWVRSVDEMEADLKEVGVI